MFTALHHLQKLTLVISYSKYIIMKTTLHGYVITYYFFKKLMFNVLLTLICSSVDEVSFLLKRLYHKGIAVSVQFWAEMIS